MCHVPKTEPAVDWRPSADLAVLKKRSQCLAHLRAFFYERDLLEVDTPMLSEAATPDVHLDSLKVAVNVPGQADSQIRYLHTSPEYPLKRLLCAGSGDLFYLGKVFRDGDLGRRHQIEFTLLEWYRLGFDLYQMQQETAHVIEGTLALLGRPLAQPMESIRWEEAFARYAGIDDPLSANAETYQACLATKGAAPVTGLSEDETDLWAQLVFTEVIEPQLGHDRVTCVTHYPLDQASLAQQDPQDERWALRFEAYVAGEELANGYQELQSPAEHRHRFERERQARQQLGKPVVPLDQRLLEALEQGGLPDCAGVALGVDRLIALGLSAKSISAVMPFGFERA
ncbi:EF-P lysine aminoacylase EpmA [Thiomicrospira sp. WB1]|uniref:EF-P lysine aminoacylase EpmA n=1 Tax=Thiomicrospira sp. WB1 TaxID=1685380 RepID=UPI000747A217|nr:EF-P lysine aminoacylase EpmA [Thiomicrospira sp. WB1]KUJ71766.1 lysine--tRNA ligase [Thiomicrospira sp. WB1]